MPHLAANHWLRTIPDEVCADVTEPGKTEWLVVVHDEFSSVAIHYLLIGPECRLLFNHPNRHVKRNGFWTVTYKTPLGTLYAKIRNQIIIFLHACLY